MVLLIQYIFPLVITDYFSSIYHVELEGLVGLLFHAYSVSNKRVSS